MCAECRKEVVSKTLAINKCRMMIGLGGKMVRLPAFGMVFLETGVEVVVVESLGTVLVRQDGTTLWVLSQVLHVIGSVAPL